MCGSKWCNVGASMWAPRRRVKEGQIGERLGTDLVDMVFETSPSATGVATVIARRKRRQKLHDGEEMKEERNGEETMKV